MLPIDMEQLRTITEKNLRFSFETLLILYLEQFAELCLGNCFGYPPPPSKKCSVHMHYSFVLSKQCFLATKGIFFSHATPASRAPNLLNSLAEKGYGEFI